MPCVVLLRTQRSPRAAAGSQRRGCPRWHHSALATRRSRLARHGHACRCWVGGWSNMTSPGMNSPLVLQIKKKSKRVQKGERASCYCPSSSRTPHAMQQELWAPGRGRGAPCPTAPDKDAVPGQGTKQKAWLGTEERLFATKSR